MYTAYNFCPPPKRAHMILINSKKGALFTIACVSVERERERTHLRTGKHTHVHKVLVMEWRVRRLRS